MQFKTEQQVSIISQGSSCDYTSPQASGWLWSEMRDKLKKKKKKKLHLKSPRRGRCLSVAAEAGDKAHRYLLRLSLCESASEISGVRAIWAPASAEGGVRSGELFLPLTYCSSSLSEKKKKERKKNTATALSSTALHREKQEVSTSQTPIHHLQPKDLSHL